MRSLPILVACACLFVPALAPAGGVGAGEILDRRPVDIAALLADTPPARLVPRLRDGAPLPALEPHGR